MSRPRHPLAQLRALTGDTQLSYAELVADTHEALGFGKLHRRREKVSRWETQGIPPDLNTQLSIAHIHQVPEEEVQRLGWPHWLRLGTAAASRAARSRTHEETVEAVRDKERPIVRLAHYRLAVTGPALASFLRETIATVTGPGPSPAEGKLPLTPEAVGVVEDRSRQLYALVPAVNPVTLYRVARAEYALTSALLADSGYDAGTGTRLLLVTARIAHLCGLISKCLGEEVRAERYYLAAARAAARAGCAPTVSACLADLAWSHIDAGEPQEALTIIDAARIVTPQPPPALAAVLHSHAARGHARRGEIIAAARALDRAAAALDAAPADASHGPSPVCDPVDERWLAVAAGRAWLDAGQPKRALEHFTPLLGDPPRPAAGPSRPTLLAARDLLAVVDAQLALNDTESAVRTARRAMALFDRVPACLVAQYRRRFAPFTEAQEVRDLMAFLAGIPAI
ncbi:hypothetical protein [Streptomyces orinoci]|uniref:Transcriptional regulator n=1 Tax=Streptomyces orinoci TaxID=67339 RepID=A0A348AZ35_STRON|nr:hypothetical protein [Streptomyces orinoci]BBD17757.1 hypothetical protein [Streptomyces orinoci]